MFQYAIVLCYNKRLYYENNWSNASTSNLAHLSNYNGLFFSNVFVCVFNESYGHWLLSNALHFAISMSLNLKEENKIIPSFESLMEDDSIIYNELYLLTSN